MKILKHPNYKSSKHFRIKGKCICGCKCQIEDFDDLYYISGYRYLELLDINFGYYCPYCGSFVELTDRANSKIIKALMNEGHNISEYIEISNGLNFRYEMGFHNDQSNDIEKIYEIITKGLPIPIHTRLEIFNVENQLNER